MNSIIFLMYGKKTKIAKLTQNGQKILIFIVAPNQRIKLKVLSTTYGRKFWL